MSGERFCNPGATTGVNSGTASVAGLLLKLIRTFATRSGSAYLLPMIMCISAPMECPTPYTGKPVASSPSARSARSNRNWFSSAMRRCSNPMANGVATTSTSPFSASASRNRRYVSWGDAPTNAPPMKCTSARGFAPAGGASTHAPSTSLQPRSRDPVFAAAEAAPSRDSSCWNGDAGAAEEEELARAAVVGDAPRRASAREAGEGESEETAETEHARPRGARRTRTRGGRGRAGDDVAAARGDGAGRRRRAGRMREAREGHRASARGGAEVRGAATKVTSTVSEALWKGGNARRVFQASSSCLYCSCVLFACVLFATGGEAGAGRSSVRRRLSERRSWLCFVFPRGGPSPRAY